MRKNMKAAVFCIAACFWLAPASFGLAQEMPEMGAPGQMKDVAFMVGDWKSDGFQFKMGPEADWETTSMTMHVEPILDGCAQRSTYKGNFMGMDFVGIATMSYSRETGKWQNSWIDNMSASQVLTEGEFKDGVITLMGKDSQMGQEVWMKDIVTKVSDTEIHWEMEMSMDGQNWFTAMKATYRKQ